MGRGLRAKLHFRPLGFMGPCLSTVVTGTGWLCVLGPAAGPLCASEGAAVWARQPPFLSLPCNLPGPPHGTKRPEVLPFVTLGVSMKHPSWETWGWRSV